MPHSAASFWSDSLVRSCFKTVIVIRTTCSRSQAVNGLRHGWALVISSVGLACKNRIQSTRSSSTVGIQSNRLFSAYPTASYCFSHRSGLFRARPSWSRPSRVATSGNSSALGSILATTLEILLAHTAAYWMSSSFPESLRL